MNSIAETVQPSGNRYSLAGWLALTQAILFPLSIIVGVAQSIIGAKAFGIEGPVVGPADMIGVLMTAIGVYVLVIFRRLLHERFNFHGVDVLITVAIWWVVVFEIGGIALKLFMMLIPFSPIVETIMLLIFFSMGMVVVGIVDIMMAVRLLKMKAEMSDLLCAYVYITLAAGIAEVSVVLSFMSFILFPVASVILGLVFFKEKEQAEFV